MNIPDLYDRFAGPALPRANPYDGRLRTLFIDNADQLLVWIVDAEAVELGLKTLDAPFPMDALLSHIRSNAVDMPGELLTRVIPFDRLSNMLGTAARDTLGTIMVELMVLHLVRAASVVAVGIANTTAERGSRIDATSHERRSVGIAIARRLSILVQHELVDEMPALTERAIAAATAWIARDRTIH